MPPKKRKRRPPYTKGQLNKIIDDLIHPHYRKNESLRIFDGIIHGLIEKNSSKSIRKFIHYNIGALIRRYQKGRGDKQHED